jgi:hypothetical protein
MRRAGLGDRRGLVNKTLIGIRVTGLSGPERVGRAGVAGWPVAGGRGPGGRMPVAVGREPGGGWPVTGGRGPGGGRGRPTGRSGWRMAGCRWPWAVGRGPGGVRGRPTGRSGPGWWRIGPPAIWDVSGGSREARDGDRERAPAPRVAGPEVRWRGHSEGPKKRSRGPMVPPRRAAGRVMVGPSREAGGLVGSRTHFEAGVSQLSTPDGARRRLGAGAGPARGAA